jgi:hypothetical protein
MEKANVEGKHWMRRFSALGPPLLVAGIFVSKWENFSVFGLSADFWGGFLIGSGILATAIWIAATVATIGGRTP